MGFEIKVTGSTKEELIDAVNELTQIMVLPVWQPQSTDTAATVTKAAPNAKPVEKVETKKDEPTAKEVTKNDIKKALVPILQEKRDEVQELFESFGVNKLSELATTDYSAFLEKVKAL